MRHVLLLVLLSLACAREPPEGFVTLPGFPATLIEEERCEELAPLEEWGLLASFLVQGWYGRFEEHVTLRKTSISCLHAGERYDARYTGMTSVYGQTTVVVDRAKPCLHDVPCSSSGTLLRAGVWDTAFSHELVHLALQELDGDGDPDHAAGSGPWTTEHDDLVQEVDADAELVLAD